MPKYTNPTTGETTEWEEVQMFGDGVTTMTFDATPEGLERAADFLLGWSDRAGADALDIADMYGHDLGAVVDGSGVTA
jgi:hypothetical protein